MMAERKPRILHVLLTAGETSAPYNEHCLAVTDRYDVSFCSFFEPTVEVPPTLTAFAGDGTVKGHLRALRRALSEAQPDVIHSHSPHVGCLLLAASAVGYLRRRAPLVCTVHNSYPNFKLSNRLLLLPPFSFYDRVVCCGEAAGQSFPWLYRTLSGKRLRAVPNGVDIKRVERVLAAARPPSRESGFHVISVGRLIPIKDPLASVEAFARGAGEQSSLVLYGAGGLKDQLAQRFARPDLEGRAMLGGLIPRDEVYRQLAAADLFISTSHGEGLPVAAMEAMACACPVLLSDIPPHRELAAGADCVPLVKPGDMAGFAAELERIRGLSAEARRELGQRCQQLVRERFSLDAMHDGYAAVYRELGASC